MSNWNSILNDMNKKKREMSELLSSTSSWYFSFFSVIIKHLNQDQRKEDFFSRSSNSLVIINFFPGIAAKKTLQMKLMPWTWSVLFMIFYQAKDENGFGAKQLILSSKLKRVKHVIFCTLSSQLQFRCRCKRPPIKLLHSPIHFTFTLVAPLLFPSFSFFSWSSLVKNIC